jgi:tripartite-type tricarboxylate transporter receptor subunit TctC
MKSPLVLLFGLLSLCAMPAAAQQPAEATGYPARPVKVIVPNAPGAALDIIGRMIAQKLSEATGAQFYVENLPGAGGTIGMGAAARAPADGYTILVINQDFVVQPSVKSKVPYDPFKSFTPVASFAAAPETISVHPSLAATSMKELIALLKANPAKYSYATPGYGTSPHIACERLFKLTYGLDVVHVPFQGGGPAVAASLAGHTQILTLRALVATQKSCVVSIADKSALNRTGVPTLEEAGTPHHEVGYWTGILVPAGTPSDIVDLLSRHVARIVSLPEVNERLSALGFGPLAGTPQELTAYITTESAEWGRVVREAKISID